MNPVNMVSRWIGDNGSPLGALAMRQLKMHLFDGNRAIIGNGTEFLAISAHGSRQPNNTKTWVTPTAQIGWRCSPILQDSIKRAKQISLSRAPYRRKSLFTFSAYTLLMRNESHEAV